MATDTQYLEIGRSYYKLIEPSLEGLGRRFLKKINKVEIYRIPVLTNNYIFLLHDPENNTSAVIDPAEAKPVLAYLEKLDAKLVAIFNTHHHWDHVGGNEELLRKFPQARVYGGVEDRGRIPGQQVYLQEGEHVTFANRKAEIFFVPGHTKGHIAYYFPPTNTETVGELFCGDTIFAGGCGRLFEGTPTQMVNSLGKLRKLPEETRIWCAHEYTLTNFEFALTITPDNPNIQNRYQEVKQAREKQEATIPTWLGVEKQTNLFLQWDDPALQSAMGVSDPVRTFARLRGKKDQF